LATVVSLQFYEQRVPHGVHKQSKLRFSSQTLEVCISSCSQTTEVFYMSLELAVLSKSSLCSGARLRASSVALLFCWFACCTGCLRDKRCM